MDLMPEQRLAIAELMGWEYYDMDDHGSYRWVDSYGHSIEERYTKALTPKYPSGLPFPTEAHAIQAMFAWLNQDPDESRYYLLGNKNMKHGTLQVCELMLHAVSWKQSWVMEHTTHVTPSSRPFSKLWVTEFPRYGAGKEQELLTKHE